MAALDAYVVVTIVFEIMDDMAIPFNRPERITPVVTAYLLGYVAAMPLLGQLSDRIGRVPVIQGCLLGFALGSVVTAAAPNLPILVGGRLIQGAAGGALLPVTFAVISDHWAARSRAVPLGLVGSAQELGSVLGPLYGAAVAALISWRGVFWINVPLAALAAIAVRRSLPRTELNPNVKLDVGGGLILAVSLGALIIGLYNDDPAKAILPSWGPPFLVIGVVGLIGFFFWEKRSDARLLDPAGLQLRPLTAALVCSFLTGVALMVMLVDIPLLAQTLLNKNSFEGALILSRFLVALAIASFAGGVLTSKFGERPVAVIGLLITSLAYWLISGWPEDILTARYSFGVGRLGFDLVLAGLGLGVVIAPLASAALRAAVPDQHGVVSASLVVARMVGMLIGIALLGALGVYRFQQLTKDLVPPLPFSDDFTEALQAYEGALQAALRTEYSEIFLITSLVSLVGAAFALRLKPVDSDQGLQDR
ncbi:MAG: MFS transporter [Actinomycetota bacterium]